MIRNCRWQFDRTIEAWEHYICYFLRKKNRTTATVQDLDWLDNKELIALIRHNLKTAFFNFFNTTAITPLKKAIALEKADQLGIKSLTKASEKKRTQATFIRISPWKNIRVIVPKTPRMSADDETANRQRIKQQAKILHTYNIPQSVLILIEKHWVCIGFRKEEKSVIMTVHNSHRFRDQMNEWYETLYNFFNDPDSIEE